MPIETFLGSPKESNEQLLRRGALHLELVGFRFDFNPIRLIQEREHKAIRVLNANDRHSARSFGS